jgi:hypothetical protein
VSTVLPIPAPRARPSALLGIDTSTQVKKRGYVVVAAPQAGGCLQAERALRTDRGGWTGPVVTEMPWAGAKLRGAALLKFAVTLGWLLRDAGSGPHYAIPVKDWKTAVAAQSLRGLPWNAKKAVFTANLRQAWRLPTEWTDDEVDACAIGVAGYLIDPLTKYRIA